MKFISLFAGIGGFDLGLERAGMECVVQVEIDDFCQKVLTKHWPDVPKIKDVRDVGKHNLPTADLICGGFPCQDVSLVGGRAGLNGKRSTLWGEFSRIVCEIQPGWVVIENVPGLLSSDNGGFFRKILRELSLLGYDAWWGVIPAGYTGAPHLRERVFIVAYSQSYGINFNVGISGVQGIRTHANGLSQIRNSEIGSAGWQQFELDTCGVASTQWTPTGQWTDTRPLLLRNDDGISSGLDKRRLGALGNAVVPQVAEFIGKAIMDANHMTLSPALIQSVYADHPKWTLDRLVAEVREQFVTARYAEIVVPHFLRLEAGYIRRYACPDCIGVDGENVYLDCEQCAQDVSNRAWYWFENVFMPNHPEWRTPEADALRAEMARLKEPQMRMEFV